MQNAHHQFLESLQPLLLRASPSGGIASLEERLCQLTDLILNANTRLNLTADDTPGLFWPRHIEDSLCAAAILLETLPELSPGSLVLDVGSGGGIPGLIWGLLWREIKLTLIESRRKRAEWLEEAGSHLNLLHMDVLNMRAETLGRDLKYRETYGLVTARALARLSTLLELTLPFAKVGGHVAAIKAADCLDEIREAEFALRELGSAPAALRRLPYTRSDGKACVVLLMEKLRPTPAAYPRREGVPLKSPL